MNLYSTTALASVDFSVITALCVYVIYREVFCLYETLIRADLNLDLCVIATISLSTERSVTI